MNFKKKAIIIIEKQSNFKLWILMLGCLNLEFQFLELFQKIDHPACMVDVFKNLMSNDVCHIGFFNRYNFSNVRWRNLMNGIKTAM